MNNKKIILYLLIIILLYNSLAAFSNPLDSLKSLYNKQIDIYKDCLIGLLKNEGISINKTDIIYIIPKLCVKDTNLFLNGDKVEFYKSLIIDSSFSFDAIINYNNNNYYRYNVINQRILGKGISNQQTEKLKRQISHSINQNENYILLINDNIFYSVISYWYIEKEDIKVSAFFCFYDGTDCIKKIIIYIKQIYLNM